MDVEEEEEFRRELAELSLSNNAAMRRIRKELKNPYRRLHSIDHDIKFVTGVLDALPGHLPAVANLRCGAWYLSPERAIRERAYFKSTDGHFGQWGFSLRRANLQLLRVIVQQGGCGYLLVLLLVLTLPSVESSQPRHSRFDAPRESENLLPYEYFPILTERLGLVLS